MLQDVAQLINIGQTRILFDNEVFRTDLFLEYKENVDTLYSRSLNQEYQPLKTVLPEFSNQVTNLHSDINGHQKTSMNFLHYNFRQIKYNVTTTLRITT